MSPIERPLSGAAVTSADWQRRNEDYLTAALAWLRQRLTWLAPGARPAELVPVPRPRPVNRLFLRNEAVAALPSAPVLDVESARRAMEEAAAGDPPPALLILGDRFGLSPFERSVLLLCAGMELDTRVAGLCAEAQQDPARRYPTFALALALFNDPAWDVLSPVRPLRFWRLIEINQPGAQPLTASALRTDERIVSYIKGLNYLDDRLAPLLVPFEAAGAVEGDLPPSQEDAAGRAVALVRADLGRARAVVQLVGSDLISRQAVAQRVARRLDLWLHQLPAAMLPREPGELETLARLWKREAMLVPVALYLDADGGEGALTRFLARSSGIFLVGTREVLGGLWPAVQVAKPSPPEQADLWREAMPGAGPGVAERLAGHFELSAPAIREIGARAGSDGEAAVWAACLEATSTRMASLAQRLRPAARWDDIVLPEQEMALLRQLAAQVAQRTRIYDEWGFRRRMNRGLGISALFAGDSGTGKTTAAEVIASALDLTLYRIDLSAVVSKYIGETEKNLRQVFDAAEDGGAILFFDEADALFGKRSEVRDSHDRYANIETSYLLQRIETYRGLAILATNMRSALDPAFLRRLRFVVTFPYPGPAQRRAIWERAWPPETPVADLDYDRLSRLNLSGGNIATVALNAAFMAATAGEHVTMPLVLEAARAEYAKLERPVSEGEFRWKEPPAVGEVA